MAIVLFLFDKTRDFLRGSGEVCWLVAAVIKDRELVGGVQPKQRV